MPVKSLSDLFIHELSDTYSAEKQMTRSLPKLARPATDEGLASAFETHLEETRGQVERIEQIAELLQIKIKRIKCEGMAGLVEALLTAGPQRAFSRFFRALMYGAIGISMLATIYPSLQAARLKPVDGLRDE